MTTFIALFSIIQTIALAVLLRRRADQTAAYRLGFDCGHEIGWREGVSETDG